MSAAITRRGVLGTLALTAFVMSIGYAQPADGPMVIHRSIWDWSRADIAWYEGKPPEKREGNPNKLAGWAEFDVEVPLTGWWELYCCGGVPEWDKTYYVDGRQIYFGPAQPEDIVEKRPEIYKVLNLPLTAGMHTLQIRRTGFPGTLPEWFELRAAKGNPAACITAEAIGPDIVRAGAGVKLQVTGGCPARATRYEFVAENVVTGEGAPAGEVSFPASSKFLTKTVVIPTPQEGCFRLRVQEKGQPLKPGDFLFHQFVVVDTRQPASPPNPLSWQERGDTGNTGGTTATPALTRTLVAEVDCVTQTPLREKDGATRIVEAPFGKYRESSGKGTRRSWACDGFSYAIDIPDTDGPCMLEVDYPDDDRRTMGFWVNDQADPLIMRNSAPVTGGVETGDRYRCSQTMQTHQAVFWPNGEHLIVAVMNLNYSMRAAAARIRVYKVEEPFPAGPPNRPDGRRLGYYYEESGRWLFHFGATDNSSLWQNMLTMDRWARFSRYTGANLLYPTINMYQGHHAPSQVLEGYFIKQFDMLRLNALIAEKYGMKYLPEFGLSGQSWFDSRVMKKGMPAGEAWTLRDKDGKAGWYNALHPFVQEKYISILGETADRLGDCPSFLGVSSRLMCSWQWMGYNALPGMNWGYDDWTVSEFTRATGIKVPGDPQDEQRFRRRFEFLTGPQLAAWRKWRC
ncbi:MAG: hypothetical protein GX100_02460, partial [candidate division WS1 bacterium]|nr:hypothetical protein [candidate division WS1 bacterium]